MGRAWKSTNCLPAPMQSVVTVAEHLAELLHWYVDMGVDIAVDAAPHDRFAEIPASALVPSEARPPAAPPPVVAEAGRRVMREALPALTAGAIEATALDSA